MIILPAVLAAIGFSASSFLALLGREMSSRGRSYSVAIAAGILLALAFADLFPEGLQMAGSQAIAGFVGGFALMFLVETFTRAHAHQSCDERVPEHELAPFLVGLSIHNLADGFVLGIAAKTSATVASGLLGFGIVVHQIPVGVSLAAVLLAARTTRVRVVLTALLLGLAIPLAATLALASPIPSDALLAILVGTAGGVLAYVGAAHLLPEAQTERPGRITGLLFATTLVVTTISLLTILGD